MNLHKYLLDIDSNKAINLSRFLSLLPELHKHNWRSIFSARKVQGIDKYTLVVIDTACFEQLLLEAQPSNNRVDASIKGDSHTHNTSMSFMLVFPDAFNKQIWNERVRRPEVVVCDSSHLTIGFQTKKTLVIIENQENFFRYQEFLPVLLQPFISDTAQLDIAFGNGNSISNSLHAEFFDQYHEVLCCFDYDLGGLTMFSSLMKLSSAKFTFIAPSTVQLNDDNFLNSHFKKIPNKVKDWHQAIRLAEQLGLADLAHAFNRTKKFMEQEVYLSNSI